jgi:hypothetical protein
MKHPRSIPVFDIVEGIARRPAPRTTGYGIRVYSICIAGRYYTGIDEIDNAAGPGSLANNPDIFLAVARSTCISLVPNV